MRLNEFLADREPAWTELESLVAAARRGNPTRLGAARIRRLGELYRAGVTDLALVRRKLPQDPVHHRLEILIGDARTLVYGTDARRRTLRSFMARDYWRRVMERPALLLVSALLLFGPWVASGIWAHADPAAASDLAPGAYSSLREEQPADLGLSPAQSSQMSAEILTNNIRVSFLAFAGGILFCIGTALVLVSNGLTLGTVTGLAFAAGNGSRFVRLVSAHGVLELSCIVVAGAAGMRMGWAMVCPGVLRRSAALAIEARAAAEIVLGTALWLVLAGLVEGFITPEGLQTAPALAVGFAIGGLFWGLALWKGRAPGALPPPTAVRATSP